jgi:hypothetical protein
VHAKVSTDIVDTINMDRLVIGTKPKPKSVKKLSTGTPSSNGHFNGSFAISTPPNVTSNGHSDGSAVATR